MAVVGKLVGKNWVAILSRKGWSCKNPRVMAVLRLFNPDTRNAFLSDGTGGHLPWGYAAMRAAARALNAKLVLAKGVMHNDPGKIY